MHKTYINSIYENSNFLIIKGLKNGEATYTLDCKKKIKAKILKLSF